MRPPNLTLLGTHPIREQAGVQRNDLRRGIMSWRTKVPGCFGEYDAEFALHPNDEKAAKEAIIAAKAENATIDDFAKEVVWYCYNNVQAADLLKPHIDRQIQQVQNLWGTA